MNSTANNKTHTPSLLQLIFNALFLLGVWGIAACLLVYGVILIAVNFQDSVPDSSLFSLGAAMFTIGLAFIPSIITSWKRMSGNPTGNGVIHISPLFGLLLAVWPILLYAGYTIPTGTYARVLLMPVIHVFSVVIPIAGLLWLGCNRLISSSHQRNAGLFSSSVVMGTGLSMIAELVLLVVAFVVLVIVLVANPNLNLQFSNFAERINSSEMDPDAIMRMITPLISSPIVILSVLFYLSVATPLIEEICKPIGLWLFARRGLTPTDGFIAGMLSGAGFTLVETIINAIQDQPDAWIMVITMRVGSDALHIFASGLMGYCMVKAWSTRNYWHLFAGYLISVSLHGLWNAFAILLSFSEAVTPDPGSFLDVAGKISPYGLGILAIVLIFGLYVFNRKLRDEQPSPIETNILPVEIS